MDKQNYQKKEFSQENKNLTIMPEQELITDKAIMDNDAIDLKKGGKININKLNIFIAPFHRRHEKYYKDSKFHLIVDIILAFIVIALTGVVIWLSAFYHQANKNVFLEINNVGNEIISGKTAEFEIIYNNKSNDKLIDGNITIAFPKNFVLKTISPENMFDFKTNTFRIGVLDSGANGKIKIAGMPFGAINSRQVISAIFNYKKNSLKLKTLNSLFYSIDNSVLTMDLSLPDEVYQGAEFDGEIKLENNGVNDLEKIELAFSVSDLEIKQSSHELNNNFIILSKIKAGEEIIITFSAISRSKDDKAFLTLTGFMNFGKEKLKQAKIKKEIVVKTSKFQMTISADKKNILADEEVMFRLNYNNKEKEKINNIRLTLTTGNDNFSLANIVLVGTNPPDPLYQGGKTTKENNILIIKSIESGESGYVDFKVKFLKKQTVTEQEIYLVATVAYDINGEKARYVLKSSQSRILSDVNLKSAGYYYSQQGDQLGVGPLPPTVDMQTNYWIFLEIDNFGNDLKNAAFIAQLPENVIWINNKSLSAGNLLYGETARTVIWTVDEVGKNNGNYRAGFEVGIVPLQKDAGKILGLLSDISFSAYDNFCKEEITKTGFKDIATDLDKDRLANGKGKVAY
ncbi:MAG: hypothetical protein V1649_02120 [Patescibacteria group bacterium]